MDTSELRDSVAYATVHLMERMSPPERAVFVLREAFGLPYEQVAEILGSTVANCRQLHSRGRRRLAGGRRMRPGAGDVRPAVNGQPAGVLYVAGEPRVCALRVDRDRIVGVYVVNNPDKLGHVALA